MHTVISEPPPLPALVASDAKLELARLLLFMQGALGVTSTLETLVVMVGFSSPIVFSLVVSAVLTIATFRAAARLAVGRTRLRRVVLTLEVFWLLGASVDLGLSLFLTRRGLGLVPTVTRILVPLVIIRVLTAGPMRARFKKGTV